MRNGEPRRDSGSAAASASRDASDCASASTDSVGFHRKAARAACAEGPPRPDAHATPSKTRSVCARSSPAAFASRSRTSPARSARLERDALSADAAASAAESAGRRSGGSSRAASSPAVSDAGEPRGFGQSGGASGPAGSGAASSTAAASLPALDDAANRMASGSPSHQRAAQPSSARRATRDSGPALSRSNERESLR
jgi:hypothetical protein